MESSKITFEFYYNEYNCGNDGPIPAEKFDYYIAKAWRELKFLLTSNYTAEHEKEVKFAVCEIAEELYRIDDKKGVQSENIDGYSVTYTDDNDAKRNIGMLVARRLGDTGLLYLGVG